jgi:hypothetical protein
VADGNGWYGRRFRTPASVDECHANARALLLTVYVAIWHSGSTVAGQREIVVVPTRFDSDAPMPLAGQWKRG